VLETFVRFFWHLQEREGSIFLSNVFAYFLRSKSGIGYRAIALKVNQIKDFPPAGGHSLFTFWSPKVKAG